MIIVDVETSGVDPLKHSILSIGAIDLNDPAYQFSIECSAFSEAHVDDEALAINGRERETIFDTSKPSEAEAVTQFMEWMSKVSDHTVGGQNPHFDVGFLLAAAQRAGINLSLPKRIVDLHSIVWYHMLHRGLTIPLENRRSNINSDFIMKYVGIPAEPHPHIASNGALYEAEAFSRLFYERSLFDEFKQYEIPWLKK